MKADNGPPSCARPLPEAYLAGAARISRAYDLLMADLSEGPGPAADDPGTAAGESPGWGRALDVAGVTAGVILVLIVADILTDGKLISRRLHRPGGGEAGDRPAE